MSSPAAISPADMRSALISECGRYRYQLRRRWASGPRVCFVMLNPSAADGTHDDPTIRRCISFAKSWGLAGIAVVNLFAWRATDSRELWQLGGIPEENESRAIGPENDECIRKMAERSALVIAAWGANKATRVYPRRVDRVLAILHMANDNVAHLGLTKDGHPRHPLYVPGATTPQEWART